MLLIVVSLHRVELGNSTSDYLPVKIAKQSTCKSPKPKVLGKENLLFPKNKNIAKQNLMPTFLFYVVSFKNVSSTVSAQTHTLARDYIRWF